MRPALLVVLLCAAAFVASAQDGTAATVAGAASPLSALLHQGAAAYTQGLSSMTTAASAFRAQATAQLEAVHASAEQVLAAAEASYCTPAAVKKGTKQPAKFVGHAYALTFSTGNCTFNESKYFEGGAKELDCVHPSLSYIKTPANFTSHYMKPTVFTTKECKVQKTFGEESTKVLYVFDSNKPIPSIAELTAKINQEISSMMGSLVGSVATGVGAAAAGPAPSTGSS